MKDIIPVVLKYSLILILYGMLFTLVLLNLLPSKQFATVVYLTIGALGGWHAKNYLSKSGGVQ